MHERLSCKGIVGLGSVGTRPVSHQLRLVGSLGYPSKVLPSKLNLDHLVELDLFESNVEQLWEGKQDVPMLRRLILGLSRNLTRIPDLSGSPYLEVIDLINCKSLLDISSSIQHLNNLHVLRLEGCESHSSFSSNIRFESLRNLDLSLCSSVMKFPQVSGNVNMLSLNGTEIEEVPSSIEYLSKLSFLDLSDCTRLKHISTNICKLKCLRSLILKNCFKLESFPEILERMESMEILDLSYCSKLDKFPKNIVYLSSLEQLVLRGNNFESLPESIKQLSNLRELWLNDCNKLQSLTVLPLGLRYLEAESCEQLQSLPDASNFAELVTSAQSVSRGSSLKFIFTNCLKLSDQKACSNVLAELLPIINCMTTTEKELQKEVNIDICYPGNEIPDWFSYLSFGSSMFIELPLPNGCNRKILGVALCVVIAFNECCFNDMDHLRVRVPFVCCVHPRTIYHHLVKLKGYLTVRDDREYTDKISIDMDHVVLGYRSYPNVKILEDDYATCTVKFMAPDELAYYTATAGVSLFVSLADFVFLGCWDFWCFIYQLVVKFICHIMLKICRLEKSEHCIF
ncbi:hypothetical protein LWI28_003317 [Acer negundo]|uniref:Uncharacterized protein n=1 Tax=Acer negundo TaxID=4023 RepID=A0AAD5NTM9_ACENE|nr:hypothetical protein LWI28_003317 [Acer negundo]